MQLDTLAIVVLSRLFYCKILPAANSGYVVISDGIIGRVTEKPVLFARPSFHEFHGLSNYAEIMGCKYLKSHRLLVRTSLIEPDTRLQ